MHTSTFYYLLIKTEHPVIFKVSIFQQLQTSPVKVSSKPYRRCICWKTPKNEFISLHALCKLLSGVVKQTWAGDTNFDLWCSSHKLPIEVVKSQLSSNQLLLKTLFNHTPALRQICPLGELRACSYFNKEKKFLWLSLLHHRDRTHSPVSPSPPHCDLPTSHLLLTHCYSPS